MKHSYMTSTSEARGSRPVIMQHCVASYMNYGGPATGFRLLMESDLNNDFDFVPLVQKAAPHGINLGLLIDLIRQIARTKPDLVHIRGLHSEGFYGVLAAKIAGWRKVVLSIHGTYTDSLNVGIIKKSIFRYLIEPITMRLADLVFCVCRYATERPYIYKNAPHLYGYIHNAAPDFSTMEPHEDRVRIRNALGIGQDEIVVIVVARITLGKGFKAIAEAYQQLSRQCVFRLVVLGDGDYRSTLTTQFAGEMRSKQFLILGSRQDVAAHLFASDIFILPTLHENLSNALLEACEAGLAIVATQVGGNPEIITHGVTGLLIPPGDSEQLANAIKLLIQDGDMRKRLAANAKVSVRQHFNQQLIYRQIKSMYNVALGRQY